jgi:enamine deaminase RidA (YjgF/YER057c/UK114 family)
VAKRLINPPELAPPRGFSHGVLCQGPGQTLYLGGQDASDARGQILAVGDIAGQYEQAVLNLQAVLAAAGGVLTDIVKLTIFVANRDDYLAHLPALGEIHRRYFGRYYPATAFFQVSAFFQADALIELDAIAFIPDP